MFRPEVRGPRGAVSSTHWLASAAGMAMFDRGGNAFDAAVAAALVLQVVEPHQNGPAGDASIQLYDALERRPVVVCGQGPMPADASIGTFGALGLSSVPGSGLLPACVPGAFGAWMLVLERYGRLAVSDVFEPAIRYAAHGFPLLPAVAQSVAAMEPLFRREWTTSGAVYLTNGGLPTAWSRLRNPRLATTLERLAAAAAVATSREAGVCAARDAFYRGFVAEEIDAFTRSNKVLDGTGRRHRGLLTGDDLARWQATIEEPLSYDYRGYSVHKAGPWSQGPVFLQQLAMLDGFDLRAMGLNSAAYLHTVVECAKLALADREAWYGDPDHVPVPMRTLLGRDYTAIRRSLVSAAASGTLEPGRPDGRAPFVPAFDDGEATDPPWFAPLTQGSPIAPSMPTAEARRDTCCVAVADAEGNLIVGTPSGGWLASSPVISALGFPLGTRGQMAAMAAGHPNALAPGKRPRTTLSPTLVLRDGEPYLAFGTPGGDQQDQWTLGFFLAHVEFGLGLQAATETVAFHTDHAPSSFVPRRSVLRSLTVEARVGTDAVKDLRDRGHDVSVVPDHSLGRICAVGLDAPEGMVIGAASPRGEQAYAIAT